jgi:4-aminobutyrate aminotransferase
MIAAEFGTPRAPNTKMAKDVLHRAGDDGLMLLTCGTFDNTIRFVPPLIVTQSQAEDALNMLDRALSKS